MHKTGRLLVVDEDYAPCGAAAEIATQVMERGFDDLDAPVKRLNGLFCPAPYSPALMENIVPTTVVPLFKPCAICWQNETAQRGKHGL